MIKFIMVNGHALFVNAFFVNVNALLTIFKSNNMVWNCAVGFSFLSLIGSAVGEGALSNIYRFRLFLKIFLSQPHKHLRLQVYLVSNYAYLSMNNEFKIWKEFS